MDICGNESNTAIYCELLKLFVSRVVSRQVKSGQLYHVTTPSFGSQPISEGKSWIPTNQIGGIRKDRYSWPLSVTLQSL